MAQGILRRIRERERRWDSIIAAVLSLFLAILVLVGGFYVVLVESLSGGLHLDSACLRHSAPVDSEYISTVDTSRFFPITRPCNEDFDLISWWLNPFIVVCALVIVALLAYSVVKITAYITKAVRVIRDQP